MPIPSKALIEERRMALPKIKTAILVFSLYPYNIKKE
jgi:hypothetical protein